MNKSKLKKTLVMLLAVGAVSLSAFMGLAGPDFKPAVAAAGLFGKDAPDHLTGSFTTIVDDQGEMISLMSRITHVGDQLITAEGRSYRIEKVQGSRATAKFLGMDPQILAYNDFYARQEAPVLKNLAEQKQGSVAVYHTHSDESYVPSDGSEAIPFKGGIYQVGKSLVDKLQGKGVQVHYDQTPHDPHDNNAYNRSRRTAASLIKTSPAAIFDVHRDGVPDASYYRATVDGKSVAKLRLVIGRENPRMDANMDFAKRMMAAANNLHPKIVKEIFVGKGDYNQDLTPTALLIEAGTHTNTREEAALGVSLFSDAIPVVAGVAPAAPTAPATPGAGGKAAGGAWKALGWILGITVVGGLGFLLISSGSWENARKRIAGFGKEFTSFFGPRRPVRKRGNTILRGSCGEADRINDPRGDEVIKEVKDELKKD
ncbi:MAG TPA: stage II sporulation protein P [Bacillota bacterium]|nr:stage II sporulation protein P [Bacillota bacterium]